MQTNKSRNTSNNKTRMGSRRPPKVGKIVRSILEARSELKYQIVTSAVAAATTAGAVGAITNNIVAGTGVTQRIGSAVLLKEVHLRMLAVLPVGGQASVLRVILVLDKLNLGTNISVTDVIQAATVTSDYNINATVNKRFGILYDVNHSLVFDGANEEISIIRKLKLNKVVEYNGTNPGKNALYLIVLTDGNVANAPNYSYDIGLRYIDT